MIDMVAVNREVERGRAELAASSEGILSLLGLLMRLLVRL